MSRLLLVAALAFVLPVSTSADAAPTPNPCEALFVPDDYGLTCSVQERADAAPWQAVVEPTEGPFRRFSRLTIAPVEEDVPHPAHWLRDRVKLDLSDVDDSLRDMFRSPDNPFSGDLVSTYLETMLDLVEAVASAPLVGCEEAHPLAHEDGWEVECAWGMGGIEKYQTMRLVRRGEAFYLITMESMNPRRMRHLAAVANSFEGTPNSP
jgi:hypothetical protein